MNARDVMSSNVVSVRPNTPIRDVAKVLLEHGVSAAPVVNDAGEPVGMVSEGDLIGRDLTDREERRDWWLTLVAEGEALNADFLTSLRSTERTARDVMAGPLITVGEETDVHEIARLLTTHRIKRVPVLRNGRLVGIVSRADLLRCLAAEQPEHSPARQEGGLLAGVLAGLDEHFLHRRDAGIEKHSAPPQSDPSLPNLKAADFQNLMADFEESEVKKGEGQREAARVQRKKQVRQLVDEHVTDETWRKLLHRARETAEHGQKELLLLRFPSQLCSDGGRAVNVAEADWPTSLRGEPAEIYLRWERELKPNGFQLSARVLDFPGGKPGDIGLFLIWGL